MAGLRWRGRPRERRRGFTLVELLVVITIIGMLMAMMFPALGSVLDVVRLGQCANNLSSVGKAIQVFQSTNDNAWPTVSTDPVTALPGSSTTEAVARAQREAARATTGAGARNRRKERPKATGYSWIVSILANLGEEPLFKKIDIKSKRFALSAFDPAIADENGHVSQSIIKVLICPVSGTTGSSAPEYKDLTSKLGEGAKDTPVAMSNFVALSATHLSMVLSDNESPNGTIFYAKRPVVKKINDGETNTVVMTETREPNYATWLDGSTAWVVAHNPNTPEPTRNGNKWECERGCQQSLNVGPANSDEANVEYYRKKSETWKGRDNWAYGPSSLHSNGLVNHLYGDKRVSTLRADGPQRIQATIYMGLVTRDGGEDVKPPE